MLRSVKRPDGEMVSFEYDPLSRRISKTYKDKTTRWGWDGNVPLHEWTDEADVTTWLFEEGSFVPCAKLQNGESYSIVTDYLGTPTEMYSSDGEKTWSAELDIYDSVRNFAGRSLSDCPFRYQGQYEDEETGLYYNRFRYYDPNVGNYISQDPIGLAGGNPTIYGYVKDTNSWVDIFGLECGKARIHHYDGDADNPFGHYSIEILDNKGKPMMHTHQVITSSNHSTTTITNRTDFLGKPNKTIEINIPDVTSATNYQNKVLGTQLGAYDKATNSCVDHVSEVLCKGGIDVQRSPLGQYKYLKGIGFLRKIYPQGSRKGKIVQINCESVSSDF